MVVNPPPLLCVSLANGHQCRFDEIKLVVTIDPALSGSSHPLAGVHFQQRFERSAYIACQRSYGAPIQWVRDFLAARPSKGQLPTSYRRGAAATDLNAFLPEQLVGALVRGLPVMDRRFHGRFLRDATLTGPEARGSSPVRVIRDPITRQSPAVAGLYPCGEGAGFAGGIISAAVDGLRTARAIAATFAVTR